MVQWRRVFTVNGMCHSLGLRVAVFSDTLRVGGTHGGVYSGCARINQMSPDRDGESFPWCIKCSHDACYVFSNDANEGRVAWAALIEIKLQPAIVRVVQPHSEVTKWSRKPQFIYLRIKFLTRTVSEDEHDLVDFKITIDLSSFTIY